MRSMCCISTYDRRMYGWLCCCPLVPMAPGPQPPAREPWGRDGRVLSVVGTGIFLPCKIKKNEKQYNVTGLNVTSLSQCMNISGFTGYICFKSLPLLF